MKEKELSGLIREMAMNGKDALVIEKEIDKISYKYPEEELRLAKKEIDLHVVNFVLASQEKSKAFTQILIGIILLTLGLGITGYTFFSSSSQYILAYGAIFIGVWKIYTGYHIYSQPIEELIPKRKSSKKKSLFN